MAKYTLLELNLDDASFTATANAPFGGSEDEEPGDVGSPDAGEDEGDETDAGGPITEDGDGGPGLVPVLIALVVLIALAALARRRMGDEPDPIVD